MSIQQRSQEIEDPKDLLPWMKLAIVRHELYGETWKAIAETMGKGETTIQAYAKSPAAKKVIEDIHQMSDTKTLVKMMMESATVQMYTDWLMAFEWAKSARDYKQVHTMVKDIGMQPILEEAKRGNEKPTTLVLNLGTADLRQLEATTAYTVDAEDVEIVSDDED